MPLYIRDDSVDALAEQVMKATGRKDKNRCGASRPEGSIGDRKIQEAALGAHP